MRNNNEIVFTKALELSEVFRWQINMNLSVQVTPRTRKHCSLTYITAIVTPHDIFQPDLTYFRRHCPLTGFVFMRWHGSVIFNSVFFVLCWGLSIWLGVLYSFVAKQKSFYYTSFHIFILKNETSLFISVHCAVYSTS